MPSINHASWQDLLPNSRPLRYGLGNDPNATDPATGRPMTGGTGALGTPDIGSKEQGYIPSNTGMSKTGMGLSLAAILGSGALQGALGGAGAAGAGSAGATGGAGTLAGAGGGVTAGLSALPGTAIGIPGLAGAGAAGVASSVPSWASKLGTVGQVLGGGAQAAAEGRRSDSMAQAYNNAANNNAQLNAANFNLKAPGTLANRGVGLAGMLNFKPMQINDSRIPTTTGGVQSFIAGLQDPQARAALLALLGQTSQSAQSGGYKVTPQMSTLQPSGTLEKAGGTAGLLASIFGSIFGK